jgi:predicted dithiol-disulfide oxidoreductase (DUF899 family)
MNLQRPTSSIAASFRGNSKHCGLEDKAHTHEGDAIAAARRLLPMVEVDGATTLIGPQDPVTLLDAFEGRRQLIAYYFMWHTGHAAPEQCEGCTWVTSQIRELSYIHSRDVTYATFCQGTYEESARYRTFMGWEMPWYSAPRESLETLLVGRRVGRMHRNPEIAWGNKQSACPGAGRHRADEALGRALLKGRQYQGYVLAPA